MWMSVLHTRDPRRRRTLEAMSDQAFKLDLLVKSSPELIREQFLRKEGREPAEDEVNELVDLATSLQDIEITPHQNDLIVTMFDAALWTLPFYTDRSIKLYRFRDPGLILSDRPLVLTSPSATPGTGVGVANADEIILPLDRRSALVLGGYGTSGFEVVRTHDTERMRMINQLVVSNAVNEIYCNPEDESRLEGLNFPDPDRPLFMIADAEAFPIRTDGVNATPIRKNPRRFRRHEEIEE